MAWFDKGKKEASKIDLRPYLAIPWRFRPYQDTKRESVSRKKERKKRKRERKNEKRERREKEGRRREERKKIKKLSLDFNLIGYFLELSKASPTIYNLIMVSKHFLSTLIQVRICFEEDSRFIDLLS